MYIIQSYYNIYIIKLILLIKKEKLNIPNYMFNIFVLFKISNYCILLYYLLVVICTI